MKGKEIVITWLIIALAYLVGFQRGKATGAGQTEAVADTIVTVVYDTIAYYQPIPKVVVEKRYERVKMPLAIDSSSVGNDAQNQEQMIRDSVEVEIPITQKVYSDSTYKAYVSGYKPSLDSLFIFAPHTTSVITRTCPKANRWGVGLQVGTGWSRGGVQPYIGVGISYNLFTF